MKAIELKEFLEKCIALNPESKCFINNSPNVGVNCDDEINIDLYETVGE